MSEEGKRKERIKEENKILLDKFKKYFPDINDLYQWKIIHRNENRFVYEGRIKKDNEYKYIIFKEKIIDNGSFNEVLKELYFLILLQNAKYFINIVDKKLIIDGENNMHLFMKFEGGYVNLKQIYNNNYLNAQAMKEIIYQISFGIYILHFNNIIHNDIKPTNILIDADYKIKIADFGSAIYQNIYRINNISHSYTKAYAPPEFLNGNLIRDQKSDIWSLGVLIVELCLETQLFNNKDSESQILKSILSFFDKNEDLDQDEINNLIYTNNDIKLNTEKLKSKIEDKQKIDDDLIDLISHLLVLNPTKRYTAKEVIMSNYLKDYFGNDPIMIGKMETPMDYKLLLEEMDKTKFLDNLQNLIQISLK